LVILDCYLYHIKELTYNSEDSLQNWGERNGGAVGGGEKNKRAIEIALASRLCDHSKLKI
jgi:hypothetical protein